MNNLTNAQDLITKLSPEEQADIKKNTEEMRKAINKGEYMIVPLKEYDAWQKQLKLAKENAENSKEVIMQHNKGRLNAIKERNDLQSELDRKTKALEEISKYLIATHQDLDLAIRKLSYMQNKATQALKGGKND